MILLIGAFVLASLNVARILLTHEDDPFGLILNAIVVVAAPLLMFTFERERR